MILSGKPVKEPEKYEDLLIHYMVHVKALQEQQYKQSAPLEVQAQLEEHIKVTEMLMWERAGRNALFRQKLMSIDIFPIFFNMDESSAAAVATGGAMGQPAVPLEANPMGEEVAQNPTGEQPLPEAVPQAKPVQQ